jgi:perosamine synthetase
MQSKDERKKAAEAGHKSEAKASWTPGQAGPQGSGSEMKKIYMAGPWITEHEVKTVLDAMENGWYEHPYDYVEKFQKEFAAYHGRKYGIMTPNCTTAIHLLLTSLGIKPGDEVILPDCTWIASGAGITYLGATPVFCDIDQENWCLDLASVERCITPKTKAVIAVDLFGNMPDMDALRALADRRGIHLIEDAAEALGSTFKGTRAGKFGVGSVFSFHRTKTLTTGEGGMLLLDDDKLYEFCMMWRDHGRKTGGAMYYNYAVTYKYMPFNVQAALGYAQFQRLDELVGKKRWIFEKYKEKLADLPDIQFNAEPTDGFNSVWITGLVFGKSHNLSKPDAIAAMEKLGLPLRPFFYPLSSLPAYPGMEAKYRARNVNAYDISARGVNLPGALNMTEDQIDAMCEGLRKVLKGARA